MVQWSTVSNRFRESLLNTPRSMNSICTEARSNRNSSKGVSLIAILVYLSKAGEYYDRGTAGDSGVFIPH